MSPWSFAQTADGIGRFALEALQAELYDGTLTADLEVRFDKKGVRYDTGVTVYRMNIDPFVNIAPPTVSVRGLVDARLRVTGLVGDPTSRRGGGLVEIQEGHLFRLPVMLAILHVINLTIPDGAVFDEATADFLIDGTRVRFQDIDLNGRALALRGSGTMSLPDYGLDLSMVNISPHEWARANWLEQASRDIVELHVTGPLGQPTVRARPLRRLTDEIKKLFRKEKPRRTQPDEN